MSSASSNRILKIFKARKTILDILETQLLYNVEGYSNFSINEIDAMFTNSQLDMLIQHNTEAKSVYIKFFLTSKQIRPPIIDEIIEDLFNIDNILTKKDTLIIIVDDEPNDTIITKLKYLYNHDGIFVVLHNINRLQFNILEHKLVPEMIILHEDDIIPLIQKYNLKDIKQLPEISRFDPQAMALCMRPNDVCAIYRSSATALEYKYYRICI